MTEIEDQIASIEKEIRETPYHKGTEHHIGLLRARLARLRDKLLEHASKKSGGGVGYAVKKQGDATAVLIGPPSVGKSTLLNRLTNAQSKVAPYAFTTVSVIPGMMYYKDAKIQILDVPGLIEGAEEGKGRGKEVLSVARGSDLIILISDIKRPQTIQRLKVSLERNGIRLNKTPPKIRIVKHTSGGVQIKTNIKQNLPIESIKRIALEMGVKNAEISLDENVSIDSLIDALSPNRVYIKSISVLNKSDEFANVTSDDDLLLISAKEGNGIGELKEKIWQSLDFIRVYLIGKDDRPNNASPLVVKRGFTLDEVAHMIGENFAESVTKARIWGSGAKFAGQEVSLTTKVQEGMQIKFI
jgi:small GTP-binding protein